MRYRSLRFPGGKFKAVTFSYDDGCRQDIRLAETLSKYGMKGTFNINSGFMSQKPGEFHLMADEIREHLLGRGHEIAVHGEYHCAPGLCRTLDALQDALLCRRALESTFDTIVRGMAYPDSGVNKFQPDMNYEKVKQYLTELDIVYARITGGDNDEFRLPQDFHRWGATAHHNNPHIFEYIEKFNKLQEDDFTIVQRHPRLFYVWGHAYEFDRNDNWDHLEKICQELSGNDEVWYATNMEIYLYYEAYSRLIFSADCSKVYNPSNVPVWFNYDKSHFCVQPGETIEVKEH